MDRPQTHNHPPPQPPEKVSISAGGRVVAAWIYDDPRLANTNHSRHQVGAFLVISSLAELADALPAVANAMAGLGAESSGGMLHIAICGACGVGGLLVLFARLCLLAPWIEFRHRPHTMP